MTQIDFYTHADNKLLTACALCAKAFKRGLRVLVYAPDAEAAGQIDRLLWTASATGFIPHCRGEDALAAVTPVVIDHRADALVHDEVLLNLHWERPSFFSRFQRLIEIVGQEEQDRLAARERFRFYRDRGYPINSHDMREAA